MLANVKDDYVLMVEPPYIPEYKHSPDRLLICIFGYIGIISCFFSLDFKTLRLFKRKTFKYFDKINFI